MDEDGKMKVRGPWTEKLLAQKWLDQKVQNSGVASLQGISSPPPNHLPSSAIRPFPCCQDEVTPWRLIRWVSPIIIRVVHIVSRRGAGSVLKSGRPTCIRADIMLTYLDRDSDLSAAIFESRPAQGRTGTSFLVTMLVGDFPVLLQPRC